MGGTRTFLRALMAFPLSLLLLAGCGYRPTSHAVKPVLDESVSTKIIISMEDPDNTVFLKDALDEAVVNRFRTRLTDKEHAQSHLEIALRSVKFIPIRYDTNGYIIAYRAVVMLDIVRTKGERTRNYHTRGSYQFTIEPNAIISDLVRFEAIKFGSEKALDSFVAQVAAEGAKR
jgi:hypothetical protein